MSVPPDPLAAIGGEVLVLLLRRRGERQGEGEGKKRGGEGKRNGLPPLYLTSGYVPVCRSSKSLLADATASADYAMTTTIYLCESVAHAVTA